MKKTRSKNIDYNVGVFLNENATSYYLLGVFCTDGCIRPKDYGWMSIITSKDKKWMENMRDIICPERKLYRLKDKNCYRLDICNTTITKWLMKNQCKPRKTLTLKFPKIPKQYLIDFMRGVIDGDGSIGLYNNGSPRSKMSVITITTASKRFANAIRSNLLTLNIQTQLKTTHPEDISWVPMIEGRIIKNKNTTYCIRITSRNALALIDLMYYSDNVFCLRRKLTEANKIRHYFANHKHRRILPIPKRSELLEQIKTMPIDQLARQLKITRKVIYRWMKILHIPKMGFAVAKQYRKGSNNNAAKLTEEDVKIIKKESTKNVPRIVLSKRFGVTSTTISSIARGKIWKHIKI